MRRHLDVFQMVLLSTAERTPLPELYEVFGRKKLVKFLDIFAGTTFTVPSPDVIKKAVRDVDIYCALEHTGIDHTETVNDLAAKYDLSTDRVRAIYDAVEKMIDDLHRDDDARPASQEG